MIDCYNSLHFSFSNWSYNSKYLLRLYAILYFYCLQLFKSKRGASFLRYRDCLVLANLWYWICTKHFFWYSLLKKSTIEYAHLCYSQLIKLNYTQIRTFLNKIFTFGRLFLDFRTKILIKTLKLYLIWIWEYNREAHLNHMSEDRCL